MTRPAPPTLLAIAILLAGALARAVQYASDRSLWFDEALLWHNIDRRSYGALLEPLDLDQGGPPGFLLGTGWMARTFGDGGYSLRLIPFVAGLACLPLAYVLARRLLSPWAVPLAMLPVALSPMIIDQSARVKQYELDLLAALAILLAATAVAGRRAPSWRAVATLAVVGVAALAVSHAAVLVLTGVGVALAASVARRRDPATLRRLAPVAVAWSAAGLALYLVNLRDLADVAERADEGELGDRNLLNPLSLVSELADLFTDPLGLRPEVAGLALIVAVAGAWTLARRHGRLIVALVASPLAVGVILAIPERYPLSERFAFYAVPPLALALGEGAVALARATRVGLPMVGPLLALAIAAGPVEGLAELPRSREELGPALESVRRDLRPGDVVWVHHPVQYAFAYHGPRVGLPARPYDPERDPPASEDDWFAPVVGSAPPVIVDQNAGGDSAQAARLSVLRGLPRVWAVISHTDPVVEAELDRLGRRVETRAWPGVTVALYDLST